MQNVKNKKKFVIRYELYKKCLKMSHKEFSSIISSIYDSAFKDGYNKACEDLVDDDTVMIASCDSIVVELQDKEFEDLLLTVDGLDKEKVKNIIDKIYDMYDEEKEEE